jgi:fucose 4-O-acetylase-like acetyltransferase
MQNYNQTADFVKGFLIILVVIGHVLLGRFMESPLRYFIYSFHMPLFFFVGGYLVHIPKLARQNWKDLLGKYWHRMLAQWLVAWIIYTLLINYKELSIKLLIMNLIGPYFHLWYVPTFFLMICIAVYAYRWKISLGILALLSILIMIIDSNFQIPSVIGRLWYMLYFVAGIYYKNFELKNLNRLLSRVNSGG